MCAKATIGLIRYFSQTMKTAISVMAGIRRPMPKSGWIPTFATMARGVLV